MQALALQDMGTSPKALKQYADFVKQVCTSFTLKVAHELCCLHQQEEEVLGVLHKLSKQFNKLDLAFSATLPEYIPMQQRQRLSAGP